MLTLKWDCFDFRGHVSVPRSIIESLQHVFASFLGKVFLSWCLIRILLWNEIFSMKKKHINTVPFYGSLPLLQHRPHEITVNGLFLPHFCHFRWQLSSLYLFLDYYFHLVDGCTWHRGWRREHGMQESAVRISMRRLYEYNSRPIYSSDTCGFEPEPADYSWSNSAIPS